jgi:hypothetical protein
MAKLRLDKEEAYDQHVHPIVQELEKTCYREGIPMFAAFAVKDDGRTTEYRNTYISARTLRRPLSSNRMAHFVRIVQGYKTIAPEDEAEFRFD